MNAIQKLLQADKESLLSKGLPTKLERGCYETLRQRVLQTGNVFTKLERSCYEALQEAIDLAGNLKDPDAEAGAAQVAKVWPLFEDMTTEEAAAVTLILCARMNFFAQVADTPLVRSAEIDGLPTERPVTPEGVRLTLKDLREFPAGKPARPPEDDLGELDPSKACSAQDGTCESCQ